MFFSVLLLPLCYSLSYSKTVCFLQVSTSFDKKLENQPNSPPPYCCIFIAIEENYMFVLCSI